MKKTLAMALSGFQGLGSDDFRERPVDRLGAMAAIQIQRADKSAAESFMASLGVELIAFKFARRLSSRANAEDKLAIVLSWPQWKLKLSPRNRDLVSRWAVEEWAEDFCKPCTGSGISVDSRGVVRGCPECGGTKKRRYSDAERVSALGAAFDKPLSEAHGIIGRAEDLAVRGAKQMLERWT